MKKILLVVLCLAIGIAGLVFIGCEKEEEKAAKAEEEKAAETAEAKEEIVIGVTNNNTGIDSYQTTHDKVLRETVASMDDVEAIVLDAQGDVTKQIDQVENLMQKDVDVIVIWPVNGKAVVPVCKKAHEEGFPIVIANSLIDESGYDYVSCFTGPDTYEEGAVAARAMIKVFEDKGITRTKKVVELMGLPGYVTAIRRSNGWQDIIKEQDDFEILATEPTDWNREKATQKMENLIVKFGDEIDGVYVADDNIGIGALNALKEAGMAGEVVMTSACLFGEGYDAIEEGYLSASVYQSPAEDARNTVRAAVDVAKGKDLEFWQYFETPPVYPENLDEFERPNF
jgi:ribose transport system substrate-binding protein